MAIKLLPTPDEDTQNELSQGKNRARDAWQIERDKEIELLVKRWTEAGSPAPLEGEDGTLSPNPDSPAHRYTVGKADVSAMKNAVRRSARLYKVSTVWFVDAKHADGSVSVKFTPAPIPVKEGSDGRTDTGNSTVPDSAADTTQNSEVAQEPTPDETGRRGFRHAR